MKVKRAAMPTLKILGIDQIFVRAAVSKTKKGVNEWAVRISAKREA